MGLDDGPRQPGGPRLPTKENIMTRSRLATSVIVVLLCGPATLAPAGAGQAQACTGENCMPANNPVIECKGENCMPKQANPVVECSGENCAEVSDRPVEECSGENCPLTKGD
jgi:hypothetical protein